MIKLKLHWKLSLFFCIALIIGFVFAYIILSNNINNYFKEITINNYKKQLKLIKKDLDDKFINKNNLNLKKYVDEKAKIIDARITIINLNGKVIADSEVNNLNDLENHINRSEIQDAINNGYGVSRRLSSTINLKLIYIASPLKNNLGILRIAIFFDNISIINTELKEMIAYTLLLVFLLVLVFVYINLFIISKPLNKLSNIARLMAEGDFSIKPDFFPNDEIGDLSRALTNLSNQIQDKIDKINQEKDKLNAVISNMFEGLIVVDKNYKILIINPSIKKLLYIVSKVEGEKLNDCVNNLDIINAVKHILKEKSDYISKEIEINIPRSKVLKFNAVPLLKNNKVQGCVLVFHDITGLRNLEKLKQDFVANVSHELRTPVTSIKGYTETIIEGAIDDKENLLEFLNIILKDSNRLANLIDDLLTLSRIESAKLNLDLKYCNIEALINECISVLNNLIKKKNHKVYINIPNNLEVVKLDEKRIEQVLFNLIDNAVKYTLENGEIKINVRSLDYHIQVSVEDNGIGIPKEDLPRMFERFYRVDKARSREMGGTGLGLSIVKHIVNSHGGKVWLNSKVGKGSTFTFTIPKK